MKSNFHGVLACGGDATRFAASKGLPAPYPKHLETVGDKTLLQRSFESMTRYLPVDGVTFMLNPHFGDLYLPHLHELQNTYPKTELSYTLTPLDQRREVRNHFNSGFENEVHGLYNQEIDIGCLIIAYGFGDTLIEGGDSEKTRQDTKDLLPKLSEGTNLVIYQSNGFSGTRLYHLAILDFFATSDSSDRITPVEAKRYGLRSWNINTNEDLINARKYFEPDIEISFGKETAF